MKYINNRKRTIIAAVTRSRTHTVAHPLDGAFKCVLVMADH